MTAGFIIGFDSDTEDVFDRQRDFIERAAIPWPMVGLLQAPPTTPLFERLLKEDRLFMESTATSNFDPPNFRTLLPLPLLLEGYRTLLLSLYDASTFYDRCYRSLLHWQPRPPQKPPEIPLWPKITTLLQSLIRQGLFSSYRKAYWKFLFRLHVHCLFDSAKLSLAFGMLLSGHHFIRYARTVAAQVDGELDRLVRETGTSEYSREADAAEVQV